jgi:hypothetical protein
MFLTTECKTSVTFPKENLWYRGTRGAQVLGAVWSGYEANKRASASDDRLARKLVLRFC